MIVILNLTLGMITPPVGGLLFVTSVVTKVPMNALVREPGRCSAPRSSFLPC